VPLFESDAQDGAPLVQASSFKWGEYGGPQTPVLATLSKDGSALYVVIANGSWAKAAPCRIDVRNFPISQAHGILLTLRSRR
jgi:hypothetical protein